MPTSKLLRITIAVLFVIGFVVIASQAAAEKWTSHGTNFTTEIQKMDVGDQEGHILMIVKQKQLYVMDNTGEIWVGNSVNTMDINPKAMKMTLQGYGWNVDKDGDKIMRTHEGKMVAKDQWSGTWIYTSGTGKYEGIKGNGTWKSDVMGPGEPSYMEVEGESEVPAK